MENNITIEEWRNEFIKQIDGFIKQWKERATHDSKNFPSTMWCADWDEQFYSYVE